MSRRIAMVLFPRFQLLDAAGPIAAFEIAESQKPGAYRMAIVASHGGPVVSSSGAALVARRIGRADRYDTIVVAGGDGTRSLSEMTELVAWLRRAAPRARRIASVCSGAFLLAEAGLLDGRRATTHWSRAEDFARSYPAVRVDADRIFIRDGDLWTSAGISAGIDLALALVEDDLGCAIARRTAQVLVVHHRRPGGQSQFSAYLDSGGANGRFATLMDWVREHLAESLSVDRLAAKAAMSPRHFARAFARDTGMTPAKAVERARLAEARVAVETTRASIDQVAEATGFGDSERMRRAFVRAFGQPPQAIRRAAQA
ncbi:MAG: GlxA family transcriptional regulator [Polyangiaceae bacterium]|jgi:transcriptional regulator GlxA family with amidase domain